MDDKGGNFYKPNEELTKWQSFKRVVWNSETKEFFGRTGISWFKITLFYIIFYACLAAFWTCMLVVFYQTLKDSEPKWKLESSRIGTSPGLGFRPSPPDENIDSTLIWFNTTNNETVEYWVKNLDKYLEPYKNNVGDKIKPCDGDQTASQDKVCNVPLVKGNHSCTAERKYGFPEGKPCVLVKLNRIYDWVPESFDEMPEELGKRLQKGETFNPKRVYITCIGENAADKDNIKEVRYYPEQGIDFKYFPFTNQDGYRSPFVFAHFPDIEPSVLVNVECQAWAKNIKFDRGDRLGSVHFELLVDKPQNQ